MVLALCLPIHAGQPAESSVPGAAEAALRIRAYDWKGNLLREGMGYYSSPDGNITTVVPVLEDGHYVETISRSGSERIVEWINPLSQGTGMVFVHQKERPVDFTFIVREAVFPVVGDSVWVLRLDEPVGWEPQKGVVLEAQEIPGSRYSLFIKTSLPLGGMGSPIINERGEVAGLVLLQAEGQETAGIIVSTNLIRSSHGLSGEIVPLIDWVEENTEGWLETETGSYLQGFALYKSRNYQKAVEHLVKADASRKYGTRKACLVLGDCYRDMGETDKAINAYEEALGRSRRLTDCHMNLVRLYLKAGRIGDARRIWEDVARYDQENPNHLILSVWLLDAAGESAGALAAAWKGAEKYPANAWAQGTLGELLGRQGRFDEAFAALERSTALRPDNPELSRELCYAAVHGGRKTGSIDLCERAVRLDFNKSISLMYLGDAYQAADLKTRAMETYRSSVKVDPGNGRAWCRLGDLLTQAGQYEEAAAAFQGAASSPADAAWIHFKLGKMYCLMGDMVAATEHLNALKELNPNLAHQLSLLRLAQNDSTGK